MTPSRRATIVMTPPWIDQARQRLLRLRESPGCWAYRPGHSGAVEPTSLAGLALVSSDPQAAETAGRWLATIQNADGSLGVGKALPGAKWPTPFGLLLWAASRGFSSERAAAVRWLLATRGRTQSRGPFEPMGHDLGLIGWPWVADTHSWVEPTGDGLAGACRCEGQIRPLTRAIEGVRCSRTGPSPEEAGIWAIPSSSGRPSGRSPALGPGPAGAGEARKPEVEDDRGRSPISENGPRNDTCPDLAGLGASRPAGLGDLSPRRRRNGSRPRPSNRVANASRDRAGPPDPGGRRNGRWTCLGITPRTHAMIIPIPTGPQSSGAARRIRPARCVDGGRVAGGRSPERRVGLDGPMS